MDKIKTLFNANLSRYGGKSKAVRYSTRLHRLLRRANTTIISIELAWIRFLMTKHASKHYIEIGYNSDIGKGFYLGHSYNIYSSHNITN